MCTNQRKRFKSGELCEQSGSYRFDGYVNGSPAPQPPVPESQVHVLSGEVFPPLASLWKDCWWVLLDDDVPAEREPARPAEAQDQAE